MGLMLKTLWNNLQGSAKPEPDVAPIVDRDTLKLFATHFPIGRKILYYPEYHQKSVLPTFIIGYLADDHFLYANGAVLHDAQAMPIALRLPTGKALPLERLKTFQLLLPDTSDMERRLDYFTRAELGPAGQFRHGNTITLVCDTADRCIPTIDTTVQRRQVMSEGPYQGSSTVLVTPEFGSLKIVDKRRHRRVQTVVSADLHFAKEMAPRACVLRDFSDHSLRLGNTSSTHPLPLLDTGAHVLVEFDFGSLETTYRLRGQVIRCDNASCVVKTERIYKGGGFEKIRMMDIVEIKTQLLNLSSAQAGV
jgi:hypothetical protein